MTKNEFAELCKPIVKDSEYPGWIRPKTKQDKSLAEALGITHAERKTWTISDK